MLKTFQNTFNFLHDAVLIVDKSMNIHFANDSASTLFDYSNDELVGSDIAMLVPDKDRTKHHLHTSHYVEKPKPRHMQTGNRLQARRKDGSEFPVSISLNAITYESGNMFCAVVRDLTEHAAMEAELLQKKKMESLGVLVGGVAHDINNIMAAIRGSVYLGRRKPEDSARHLSTIDAQCEYATDIVQQMLLISNDENIETSDFSLSKLLSSSKRLFRAAVTPVIDLSFHVEPKQVYIHGSPTLISQSIINLILNARDAVENTDSPAISVTVKDVGHLINREPCANGYLCISVADNGHGMDKSTMARIFEPFYTTKASTKGTGLGLAIVYNAVQICGGYVDVESVIGKGTNFHLYLPMIDIPAQTSQANNTTIEEIEGSDDTGILLVEDNKAVRKVNRDIIESMGYTSFAAKNGRTAVKKASLFQEEIGLIIMDISMPEKGGIEAALEIRKKQNQVPIIFYSGNTDFFKSIEHHATTLYPFSLLSKPFNVRSLGKEIHTLLQLRSDID